MNKEQMFSEFMKNEVGDTQPEQDYFGEAFTEPNVSQDYSDIKSGIKPSIPNRFGSFMAGLPNKVGGFMGDVGRKTAENVSGATELIGEGQNIPEKTMNTALGITGAIATGIMTPLNEAVFKPGMEVATDLLKLNPIANAMWKYSTTVAPMLIPDDLKQAFESVKKDAPNVGEWYNGLDETQKQQLESAWNVADLALTFLGGTGAKKIAENEASKVKTFMNLAKESPEEAKTIINNVSKMNLPLEQRAIEIENQAKKLLVETMQPPKKALVDELTADKDFINSIDKTLEILDEPVKDYKQFQQKIATNKDAYGKRTADVIKRNNFKVSDDYITKAEQNIEERIAQGQISESEIKAMQDVIEQERQFLQSQGNFDRVSANERKKFLAKLEQPFLKKQSAGTLTGEETTKQSAINELRKELRLAVEGSGDDATYIRELNDMWSGLNQAEGFVASQRALAVKEIEPTALQKALEPLTMLFSPSGTSTAYFVARQAAKNQRKLENITKKIINLKEKAGSVRRKPLIDKQAKLEKAGQGSAASKMGGEPTKIDDVMLKGEPDVPFNQSAKTSKLAQKKFILDEVADKDSVIIKVDPEKLQKQGNKDVMNFGASEKTTRTNDEFGNKLQRANDFIKNNKEIKVPNIVLFKGGQVQTLEGAHRFRAMKEMEQGFVPISISKKQLETARKQDWFIGELTQSKKQSVKTQTTDLISEAKTSFKKVSTGKGVFNTPSGDVPINISEILPQGSVPKNIKDEILKLEKQWEDGKLYYHGAEKLDDLYTQIKIPEINKISDINGLSGVVKNAEKIKDVKVQITDYPINGTRSEPSFRGVYDEATNTISINGRALKREMAKENSNSFNEVVAHEIQHAIDYNYKIGGQGGNQSLFVGSSPKGTEISLKRDLKLLYDWRNKITATKPDDKIINYIVDSNKDFFSGMSRTDKLKNVKRIIDDTILDYKEIIDKGSFWRLPLNKDGDLLLSSERAFDLYETLEGEMRANKAAGFTPKNRKPIKIPIELGTKFWGY